MRTVLKNVAAVLITLVICCLEIFICKLSEGNFKLRETFYNYYEAALPLSTLTVMVVWPFLLFVWFEKITKNLIIPIACMIALLSAYYICGIWDAMILSFISIVLMTIVYCNKKRLDKSNFLKGIKLAVPYFIATTCCLFGVMKAMALVPNGFNIHTPFFAVIVFMLFNLQYMKTYSRVLSTEMLVKIGTTVSGMVLGTIVLVNIIERFEYLYFIDAWESLFDDVFRPMAIIFIIAWGVVNIAGNRFSKKDGMKNEAEQIEQSEQSEQSEQ